MNKRKSKSGPSKPVVKVKPHTYQPSKAELEADVSIRATPDEVRRATMQSVTMLEEE